MKHRIIFSELLCRNFLKKYFHNFEITDDKKGFFFFFGSLLLTLQHLMTLRRHHTINLEADRVTRG